MNPIIVKMNNRTTNASYQVIVIDIVTFERDKFGNGEVIFLIQDDKNEIRCVSSEKYTFESMMRIAVPGKVQTI